ncbi:MAG: hypothetical protein LPK02_00460, partial [Rhodobacterales bacterium]|nr:hypothetical protein [Rhodobacterales bacterium]MDX5411507.1 hypothetical protein [Rhodobacterales bacterium]
ERAETLREAGEVQALYDDADAPICMRAHVNGGSFTFASALFEITDAPIIRMRKGPAGGGEWQQISFPA